MQKSVPSHGPVRQGPWGETVVRLRRSQSSGRAYLDGMSRCGGTGLSESLLRAKVEVRKP